MDAPDFSADTVQQTHQTLVKEGAGGDVYGTRGGGGGEAREPAGRGAAAGAVRRAGPVQRVGIGGGVDADVGAADLARGPVGAERHVPGGERGDAGGDFEARAGAAGGDAAAFAGGGAGEEACVDGVGGGRAAAPAGVVQRGEAGRERARAQDGRGRRQDAVRGAGAVLVARHAES